ncbi:hypothetical protein DPSP01_011300 [Paraphaeosphaeria sporulosa]
MPLLGNIRDLPPPGKLEYTHWLELKNIYGPISSITVLGQTLVFIHDKNIADELLNKRSAIYSGRPRLRFGLDMVGWIDAMSSLQNNALHRLYRKYAYQQIGSKAAVSRYHSMQEAIVGRTLQRMKECGGRDLVHNLKTQTGSLILRVLYGYKIEQNEADPLIAMADVAMDQFSQATVPGRWLVDTIPMLAHVPEWLPGAGFKKTARLWRHNVLSCVNVPYNFARKRHSGGSASMSFVSRSMDEAEADNGGCALSEEQEHAIKWTAVSLYVGGEDTSAETLNAFFLAMSMFHNVQRKAQEEIDRVVGAQRMPNFGDRDRLPYLNAVVDEALRWHPIVPMGVPHLSDEEDCINGYRIPKGAIVLPNVWWFSRDSKVYHDPETFKPERYMEPYNEPSPRDFVFGFGRRICPGRVLADSSLYLTFAQVLATFNVVPAVNERGDTVKNVHTFGPGLVSKVGPFSIEVRVRSEAHGATLDELMRRSPSEESDAKYLDGLAKGVLSNGSQ